MNYFNSCQDFQSDSYPEILGELAVHIITGNHSVHHTTGNGHHYSVLTLSLLCVIFSSRLQKVECDGACVVE